MRRYFFLFLFLPCLNFASISSIYKSIDHTSLSHLLAFYELYPNTDEGKKSLKQILSLLSLSSEKDIELSLPKIDIQFITSLVNRFEFDKPTSLSPKQTKLLEKIGTHLANRKYKGHDVWKEKDILSLPVEEIDISRALFITQLGEENQDLIRYYEATVDLMALQILAKLKVNASDEDKIHAINDFIFFQMKFRFPPHAIYAQDIDLYTFLPSVIDSRKGVCLGVSLLYLCIAQRLDLPLEIITPPGHIYLRYRKNDGSVINVETTARGIHLPSEVYLGIETKSLLQRNNKETIGLAFINQASVCWMREEYNVAIDLYEKALPYITDTLTAKELLAYNYLFANRIEDGEKLLNEIKDKIPSHAVTNNKIIEDYLSKKIDVEGIKALFLPLDETRESLKLKQQQLTEILKKYPKFRAGIFLLATTWLQLGRTKEAQPILERYLSLDKNDPLANYYLSIVYYKRLDYNKAWKHYFQCDEYLSKLNHHPKALKDLYREYIRISPPPEISKTF